jgi:hypothetical protein
VLVDDTIARGLTALGLGATVTMSEAARHALHSRLVEVLGPEEAVALMEYLPPVGWADVATKRDVDQLAIATKRDLDHLGIQIRGEIAEVRGVFGELRGEMGAMEGRLRQEIGAQMRATYVGMVATVLAAVGSVAAATATAH